MSVQLESREMLISPWAICKENTTRKNSWIEISDETIPKPKIRQ